MLLDKKFKPELCMGKDESGLNLAQLYANVETNQLMATDGHCMVLVSAVFEPGETSGTITSTAWAVARLKAKQGNLPSVSSQVTNGLNNFFGSYQQLIPRAKKPTVSINPERLAKLAKAMGAKGVSLQISSEQDSILVTPCDYDDNTAVGVLMPMRAP